MSRFLTNTIELKNILTLLSLLLCLSVTAQSEFCNGATEFCVDVSDGEDDISYPATTNATPAPPGNNYGCLATQPNPAWFYFTTAMAGATNIQLTNSSNVDVDFALWGPFPNLQAAQANCGFLQAPVSCSYSPQANETVSVISGGPGEVFLLLITNFSNSPTNISGTGNDDGVIACASICAAEGGVLNQEDVEGCIGDPNLNVNVNPEGENTDAGYSYTYAISPEGGGILFYQPTFDINGLGPGTYEVCGLSYATPDFIQTQISLGQSVSDLQTQLESDAPPFCGDFSDDCFMVTLAIPPLPEFRDTMVPCLEDVLILPNGEECGLTVGDCSYEIDVGGGCTQTINYIVQPGPGAIPTFGNLDTMLCFGQCMTIQGIEVCAADTTIMIQNYAGCDSILVTHIDFIDVNADIATPDMLTCVNSSVTLDATSSTGGDFEWTDEDGNVLGTSLTLNVSQEGCYLLSAYDDINNPGCVDTMSVCVTNDNSTTPTTPQPTGDTPICENATGQYSVTPEANTTYNWTVTGGNITAGQGTENISVEWTGSGSGTVCVTAENICGPGAEECFDVTINAAPDEPTVSGDATVCPDGTGSYTVTPITGITGFLWSVPAGAVITSGQGTADITVDFGNNPGDVCVIISDDCGDAPQACFSVDFFELPADASVSGATEFCPGETFTYTTPADPNTSTYNWTVPACATIDSGQGSNTITVTWGASCTAGGDICVDVTNNCGSGQNDCLPVNIQPTPNPPTIGGPTVVCENATENYFISTPVTGETYSWTAPTGATIIPGPTSDQISIDWGSSAGGDVCVIATGICGDINPVCIAVSTDGVPDLGNVVGNNEACVGSTNTYSIGALSSATGYTWSTDCGNILSGQNTTEIDLEVSSGCTIINLCVEANTSCGATAPACITISVTDVPPAPTNISGNASPCLNSTETYCVDAVNGADSYTWSVVGNGTITGGQTTDCVTVEWTGTGAGQVCVTPVNACGNGQDLCFDTNVEEITAVQITTVCNNINTAYTVSFTAVGGTGPYTVSGLTGTWTGNDFVSDELAAGAVYAFSVTDANTCTSIEYTGSFLCDCTTDSGTIQVEALENCEDLTVQATHNGGEVLDGNDITQFVISDGDPVNGQIFDANTTGEFGLVPPMVPGTTYFIAFAVGNNDGNGNVDFSDPCVDFTEGVPVVFHAYPTPDVGQDAAICGLSFDLSAIPTANIAGVWAQTSGTGTSVFTDENAANTTVTVSDYGMYTYSFTQDNSGCIGSDEIEITFNSSPSLDGAIAEICNNTNTAFTIEFSATGGSLPYSVTGVSGTWTGADFVSDEIPGGSSYSFVIVDANGCVSGDLTGSHICDCDTDAGTMSASQIDVCADQTAQATHNGDEVLDGNDVTEYILHNGDPINGQIFDRNNTGIFGLVDPMQTDVTYFISLAVGDPNGAGGVDLNADCADVATGQPVVFHAYPMPSAGPDTETCGLTIDLAATIDFAGGEWTLTSGPGTAAFTDNDAPNSSVTVTDFGTYTFTWTEDNFGCIGSDEVEISFNDAPMLDGAQMEECDLNTSEYTVTFDITGGEAPYFVNGVMITGSTYVSAPIASNVVYSFDVTDNNGCGPFNVTGVRNCDCQTDAGTMEQDLQGVCIGGMVSGLPNGDEVNDGDDAVQYILHDGPGTLAGTIFAISNTPDFSLVSPMMTGTIYYISTIIGNDLGGGVVDQDESCFRVAVGTPVIFYPLPDGTVTGNSTICEGGSAEIEFNLTGTAPFSIVFDGNTFNDQPAQFTQVVSPAATSTYELTEVTDANGCVQTVSSSVAVVVNTPPSATITQTATICNSTDSGNGTILNFSDFVTGGDMTGTWEDTDNSGANGPFTALNFDGTTEGVYTFTYTTATAAAPCDNVSYTMEVTIEDCVCPSVETSAPSALCNDGGILDLTTLQVTEEAGSWAIINSPAGANASLNGSVFDATGLPNGEYTFEFTLTEAPPVGCPTTSQETLTVNNAVTAGTANAAMNFCENEGAVVDLSGELSGADAGGTWSETSATGSTGGAFNANAGTFNSNGQSPGTYTFLYTVAGTAPCADATVEVSVIVRPEPVANAGEDQELTCFEEEVGIGDSSPSSDLTYEWSAADGGLIAEEDLNNPNLIISDAGTYTLTVTDNITGCSDTDVVTVTSAQDIPIAEFSISNISCFGESDGLITIDSVSGGEAPYVYSLDGENFSTTTFYPNLSAGLYEITVQDANGCTNTVSFDIPMPDELTVEIFAFLDDDNVIRFGDSLELSLQTSVDFDSLDQVLWEPRDILDCDTCQTVLATPFETTNFSVMISDDGCTAEDDFQLVVRRDAPIFVPNAFSPNNDDYNNVLVIYAGDQVASIKSFLVFNRWGEAVHEYYNFLPNDPVFGWDGTHRGEPLNPAVFAWYAEVELIDGRTEILEGDVTLFK